MSNADDPYNWGAYPSDAELGLDECATKGCHHTNYEPASRHCWWHSSDAEKVAIEEQAAALPSLLTEYEDARQAAVDAADSVGVDADWGTAS